MVITGDDNYKDVKIGYRTFMTGSRVIGGSNDNSDYDLVVKSRYREDALEYLKNKGYERHVDVNNDRYGYSTNAIYMIKDSKVINLVCVKDTSLYISWYIATKVLSFINSILNTKLDKKTRVFIFETIVSLSKFIMHAIDIDIDDYIFEDYIDEHF